MTSLFRAKIALYYELLITPNLTKQETALFIRLGQDPEVRTWAEQAIQTALKK